MPREGHRRKKENSGLLLDKYGKVEEASGVGQEDNIAGCISEALSRFSDLESHGDLFPRLPQVLYRPSLYGAVSSCSNHNYISTFEHHTSS